MFRSKLYRSFEDAKAQPSRVRRLYLLNTTPGHGVSLSEFRLLVPKMAHLQELHVGWQLWTAIPEELAHLPKLRVVVVLNTPVALFPSFLAACPLLKELVLRGTDITTIPRTIGEFHSLRRLDLSNNALCQAPDELQSLSRLREFVIHATRFTPTEADRIRSWFAPGVVFYTNADEMEAEIRKNAD